MQTLPASSSQSSMAGCDLQGAWRSRQSCALTFQAGVHVALMVLQGVVSLGMIFHHIELLAGLSHPGSRPTWGKKMGCAQAKCWGEGRRGQGDRGAPPHFMEGKFLSLLSILQQVEYPASSGGVSLPKHYQHACVHFSLTNITSVHIQNHQAGRFKGPDLFLCPMLFLLHDRANAVDRYFDGFLFLFFMEREDIGWAVPVRKRRCSITPRCSDTPALSQMAPLGVGVGLPLTSLDPFRTLMCAFRGLG